MKTLALANGDLVVGSLGHKTVTGVPKIRQDLALALGEELGTDRFHPEMGGVLIEYVGQLITDETELLVRSEVARIVSQYIAVQEREVLRDHLAQRASRFSDADVVTGITGVSASVNLDSVLVQVGLITRSGAAVNIQRTVGT